MEVPWGHPAFFVNVHMWHGWWGTTGQLWMRSPSLTYGAGGLTRPFWVQVWEQQKALLHLHHPLTPTFTPTLSDSAIVDWGHNLFVSLANYQAKTQNKTKKPKTCFSLSISPNCLLSCSFWHLFSDFYIYLSVYLSLSNLSIYWLINRSIDVFFLHTIHFQSYELTCKCWFDWTPPVLFVGLLSTWYPIF